MSARCGVHNPNPSIEIIKHVKAKNIGHGDIVLKLDTVAVTRHSQHGVWKLVFSRLFVSILVFGFFLGQIAKKVFGK